MNIYITFDYELFFGNSSGSAENCIIKPTEELIKIADRYGVKFVFFVDSGYLLKLQEYKDKYEYVQKEYDIVFEQIKKLNDLGHDIQLHIHPHWEDSYFDGKKWVIDTKRYTLHSFSDIEIDDIVYRYKKVLEDIIQDSVFAFRAGGWCIQPFDKLKNIFKKYNIYLDSTVFNGGHYSSGAISFDFRKAPNKDSWKFSNDILQEDKEGFFTEIPIASMKISPIFYWKFAFTKKFAKNSFKIFGDGSPVGASNKDILKMLTQPSYGAVSCDGYRSSLLEKAYKNYKYKKYNHFVIIGHPKGQSAYSLQKLEMFVKDKYMDIKSFRNIF